MEILLWARGQTAEKTSSGGNVLLGMQKKKISTQRMRRRKGRKVGMDQESVLGEKPRGKNSKE